MLKNTKRVLSVIFASVLLFNLLQTNVYAEGIAGAKEKIACKATLEDEFADNCVMVVLDNETSLAVDQFSTSMFSGISCKEVQSLTTAKEAKVQEKVLDTIAELEKQDGVVYAGPDYVLTVGSNTPDDPYYTNGNQWQLIRLIFRRHGILRQGIYP